MAGCVRNNHHISFIVSENTLRTPNIFKVFYFTFSNPSLYSTKHFPFHVRNKFSKNNLYSKSPSNEYSQNATRTIVRGLESFL